MYLSFNIPPVPIIVVANLEMGMTRKDNLYVGVVTLLVYIARTFRKNGASTLDGEPSQEH